MKKIFIIVMIAFAFAGCNINGNKSDNDIVNYGKLSDRDGSMICYSIAPNDATDDIEKKEKTKFYISDSVGSKTYFEIEPYGYVYWSEILGELKTIYEWDSLYTTYGIEYGKNFEEIRLHLLRYSDLDMEKRMAYLENKYGDRFYISKEEYKRLMQIYADFDKESPIK